MEDHIGRKTAEAIAHLERNTDLRSRRLPMQSQEKPFKYALQMHDVVSVEAPPGAGKSLELGVYVLGALSQGLNGRLPRVAMTQPRRDAAQGVCCATAARHGLVFGKDISFSTSEFHGNRKDTSLQIQTTGILLNQFRDDAMLLGYDAVIVDEAHERGLDIDLVIGLLKRANKQRSEQGLSAIKIVVASATLEQNKFKDFFHISADAAIRSSGRMFEVRRQYLSEEERFRIDERTGEKRKYLPVTLAANEVEDILNAETDGDILVFMPGKREIEDLRREVQNSVRSLMERGMSEVEVLMLHGENSQEDRANVLRGGSRRRVIIATNIAETSLTVPKIKHVVDSCVKKEMVFYPETGLEVLEEVPATKAECEQRAGRAGRLTKGVARRLLTEEEYEKLKDHPRPEIQRLDLSSMILRMMLLGVKDVESFEFIDPPPAEHVQEAIHLLYALGAVTEDRELTPVGREMVRLPLAPRLARVVIEAKRHGCVDDALAVASLMEGRGVFRRPESKDYVEARRQLLEEKQREDDIRSFGHTQRRPARPEEIPAFAERIALALIDRGEENVLECYSIGSLVNGTQLKTALVSLEEKGFITSQGTLTKNGKDFMETLPRIPRTRSIDSTNMGEQEVESRVKTILNKKQEKMREGVTSDWVLHHRIFQGFLRAPNRVAFCEENGFVLENLEKGLKNYGRLWQELRGYIEKERPGAALNEKGLAMAILAGYAPDHLIQRRMLGLRGGARLFYERIDRGTRDVHFNSNSVVSPEKAELAVCVNLSKGETKRSAENRKNMLTEEKQFRHFAVGIHPVSSEVLFQSIPHLVRRAEEPKEYKVNEVGNVLTVYTYQFRNKEGTWINLPDDGVLEQSSAATAELASAIVRQSLDVVQNERFRVRENRETAKILDNLRARARGAIGWKGLETWYADRLCGAITIEEALAQGEDRFLLRVEDVCSEADRSVIEEYAPEALVLGGDVYTVRYEFSPANPKSMWESERVDRLEVEIFRQEESLEKMYQSFSRLENDTEGMIRTRLQMVLPDDPMTWHIRIGYNMYRGKQLEEIREKIEQEYLYRKRSSFVPPEAPYIDPLQEHLPSLQEMKKMGIEPVVYAIRYNGDPLYLFPALYGVEGQDAYMVKYFPSQEAAKETQKYTETVHQGVRERIQRKRDRVEVLENGKTMLQEAVDACDELLPRIKFLYEDTNAQEAAWITRDDARRCLDRVEEANRGLRSYSGGISSDADPRKALQLLRVVERELAERRVKQKESEALLEELRPRIKKVQALMQEKMTDSSYAQTEYGISLAQYATRIDEWNQLQNVSEIRVARFAGVVSLPDAVEAERLLDGLERFLKDLMPPEDLELRRVLQRILGEDRKNRLARVLIVKGGKIIQARSPFDNSPEQNQDLPKEIPIGKSGRHLIVNKNVITQSWGGSGALRYALPDGTFVVSRDALDVLRVDPTPEGDGWIPREEMNYMGQAPEVAVEEVVRVPGRTSSTTAGLFQLAAAKRAEREPFQAPPAEEAPRPRQEHKIEKLTPEMREKFLDHLFAARVTLERWRKQVPMIKMVPGKTLTDQERKCSRLQEALNQRLAVIRSAEEKVRTFSETENTDRARGIVGEVTQGVATASRDVLGVIQTQKDLFARVKGLVDQIPEMVAKENEGVAEEYRVRLSSEQRQMIGERLAELADKEESADLRRARLEELVMEALLQ